MTLRTVNMTRSQEPQRTMMKTTLTRKQCKFHYRLDFYNQQFYKEQLLCHLTSLSIDCNFIIHRLLEEGCANQRILTFFLNLNESTCSNILLLILQDDLQG